MAKNSEKVNVKVEVNTSEYESGHGKKARGTGCWVFWMGRSANKNSLTWTCFGKYGEAKKQAQAKALEQGYRSITVAP
jgi:hypothetical protein